jgi:hypothetical protein
MSQSTLGELTETVTDVLSTAADQVGHASEAVLSLVDSAREKVHPTPRRRFNPWFLVAAALATALAVGFFVRRRRADDGSNATAGTSDLRDYRAAAGS